MLPKSRRALTIQEIAALARSSLHGISQVMKEHVTKPTTMAQGRVAHLIEWKGWSRPIDTPAPASDLNRSYSALTEGEQEARFAAGVAEQFAIAEAKLRAWSSVDGDESNDDSYDEDFPPNNDPSTQSTDLSSYPPYLKDLIHSQLCHHLSLRGGGGGVGGGGGEGGGEGGEGGSGGGGEGSGDPSPSAGSPDTLCSSLCSLDDHLPLLRDLNGGHRGNYSSAAELAAKILSALQGGEELLLARLQRAGSGGSGGGNGGGRGGGIRPCGGQDSPCYSMSYSETYLSPGEEEDDDTPCKDYENTGLQVEGEGTGGEEEEVFPPEYVPRRRVSDVASSGVVSLDEEEELEEEEERAGDQQ